MNFFHCAFPSEDAPITNLATNKPLRPEQHDSLVEMMIDCEISNMSLLPNFEFDDQSGPRGFSAKVSINHLVNADLLRCGDLFRVISIVKLKIPTNQFTSELGNMIEQIRLLLPIQSPLPPTLIENGDSPDVYVPCLGQPNTSLSICHRIIKTADNRQETEHFLVCHSALPDSFATEIQEALELISRNNHRFKKAFSSNGSGMIDGNIQPVDYGQLVSPGGLLYNTREIAIQNNIRIIDVFAQMAGLILDAPIQEERHLVWPVVDEKNMIPTLITTSEGAKKLQGALEWWPRGVTIFPFSTIPEAPEKSGLSPRLLPPAYLANFPIGGFLLHLKTEKKTLFESLKQTYQISFECHPRTFQPFMRTVYNTFSVSMQSFVFHSHSAPIGHDFIFYEGPSSGFRIYNFVGNADTREGVHWRNGHNDSFPVIFPYKENRNIDVKEDLVARCFTPTKGGTSNSSQIPDELYQVILGLDRLNSGQRYLLPPSYVEIYPLKVFLAPDNPFDIQTISPHN